MPRFTALYDACVLYPAPLRDLLVNLALTGLFHARWTEAIHDEWMRNLLANEPHRERLRLERTRDLMNNAVLDCLITGYEYLIPSLALSFPDPGDRHILAAAICGRADVIVTFNLKHFPADILKIYGVEPQHPDDFVASLIRLNPGAVCDAVKRQRENLRNPPRSADELLETLQKQGLPQTVAQLQNFAGLI